MTVTQVRDSRIDTLPTVSSRATVLWGLVIFTAWAAIVAVGLLHHAFWRDEVRALSLALDADSMLSIPTAIHGEGHPALWYLLLRVFYDILGTKAVLPLVSLLAAAAPVIIFLWRAPFSLWWKALFATQRHNSVLFVYLAQRLVERHTSCGGAKSAAGRFCGLSAKTGDVEVLTVLY